MLISGFTSGNSVDFEAVPFGLRPTRSPTQMASSRSRTGVGATIGKFEVAGTYTQANFHLGADPRGRRSGQLCRGRGECCDKMPAAPARPTSSDGLVRRLWTPPSTPERAGPASGFNSWSALVSGAGTDPGGFGFHYENDRNGGGGRDPLGVDVGWNGPVGHGPGTCGS